MGRALLFVLCLAATSASAVELSGEMGQCRFTQERNGTFFESDPAGLDYKNYMTPKCGSVALASRFGDSAWGWRLAYVDTGTIKAINNVARYGDDMNRQPCDPVSTIGCKALFNGSGYTYGVSASLTYTQRLPLGFSVTPEAGLFFFRHRFHAKTAPLEPMSAGELQYDETSSWSAEPAKLVGLTLRHGDIYFAVRHYFDAGKGKPLSLTNHDFTQFSLGAVLAKF